MKINNTLTLSLLGFIMTFSILSFAQTNVFDDVIATSSNHTYLEAISKRMNCMKMFTCKKITHL